MDQHVKSAITRGLRDRQIDVVTAFELEAHRLPDDDLLRLATELGRVLVTHDNGFPKTHARWRAAGLEHAGIVYCSQMKAHIGRCVQDLELLGKVCDPEDMANHLEHIPLK